MPRTLHLTPKNPTPSKNLPLAWERQPGETDKAFEAWGVYRDKPPQERSYRTVAATLNKSETLIARWASQWHWQDRISAWQDFLDQKSIEAKLRAIEKMHEEDRQRERALGLNILGKVSERFLEKDTKGHAKLKVPDTQIPLWTKTGVDLIRISDGLSTNRTDVTVGGNPDGMPIMVEHRYILVDGVKPPMKIIPELNPAVQQAAINKSPETFSSNPKKKPES